MRDEHIGGNRSKLDNDRSLTVKLETTKSVPPKVLYLNGYSSVNIEQVSKLTQPISGNTNYK
jgi:hypothetical protein